MQASGGFRLIVRRGPQPNQVYEMTKEVISLGRDITNDIVINDPEVSRHHCRLSRTPNGYTMEDLGSTNGTFVSGQRLTGARPLVHGDMIGLGETVTLAYEGGAVQQPTAGEPSSQQQTVMGATAQPGPQPAPQFGSAEPGQQPGYAPPGQQQPGYGQPPYSPPQGQQPAYGQQQPGAGGTPANYYYEEEPRTGGAGRWIALGCGCLIVLCIITLGVAIFLIDMANLWCDLPIIPDLLNLNCAVQGALLPILPPFV